VHLAPIGLTFQKFVALYPKIQNGVDTMEQRIQIGIAQDKLQAGQKFRVRRPSGELWVEVPQNATYGTEIHVRHADEDLLLVLVPPRRVNPITGAPFQPDEAPSPNRAPVPEQHRAAPNISGGLLIDRLPEKPVFAGTPNFWDRVREELWESVQQKKEFAGVCVFEELPDGILFYDVERRWQGEFDNTMIDFSAGDALWHTHPTDILQEANEQFSEQDREESDLAKKPLALFAFGKSSPGYLAQFLLLPNIATLLANLSIRGVIELERRGTLPPNLMKFGIRARIYVPRLGEFDILRVEEERPRNLEGAEPIGLDRYTTPAVEAVKKAAGTAVEAGKGAATKVYEAGHNLYETGGGSAREYLKSGAETAQEVLKSGAETAKSLFESGKEATKQALTSETAQNVLETGKDAATSIWNAGKKLFGRKEKNDKDEEEAPKKSDKKDNLDW
jgi:hypothetical protein